jgi:hypothetical protein
MDHILYKLLPFGGDWWHYRHENATNLVQDKSRNLFPVVNETPSQSESKSCVQVQLQLQTTAESSTSQNTNQMTTGQTTLNALIDTNTDNNRDTNIDSNAANAANGANVANAKVTEIDITKETHEVFEYILEKIDNLYPIYSQSMKETANKMLKLKLQDIVASPDGQLYFGPRKTRSIVAWISGNPIAENSEIIIAGFIAWILDESVISEQKKKDIDMGDDSDEDGDGNGDVTKKKRFILYKCKSKKTKKEGGKGRGSAVTHDWMIKSY